MQNPLNIPKCFIQLYTRLNKMIKSAKCPFCIFDLETLIDLHLLVLPMGLAKATHPSGWNKCRSKDCTLDGSEPLIQLYDLQWTFSQQYHLPLVVKWNIQNFAAPDAPGRSKKPSVLPTSRNFSYACFQLIKNKNMGFSK
ncbi:hypothetical protein T4D_10803 [Trichinella pseudospiralis]|uniref:Uncharacterized protein n=1 Tax=Trichinella pseudospiralis TaxID=6337 RepID=A0A0V1FZW8_TRIPS|nr:hypothetical protein T4D_10803 [Trichinella pseudospiralis]